MESKKEEENKSVDEEKAPKINKKSQMKKDGNPRQNKIWCTVCRRWMGAISYKEHLEGRKHQNKLRANERKKRQSTGVIQKGLIVKDPPSELGTEVILDYFEKQFGGVLAITKLNSRDVLVQFQHVAAAEEARKSASHVIQGFIIAITPRVKGREDGYEFNSPGRQISKKPPLQQILKKYLRCSTGSSLEDQLNLLVGTIQASEKSKNIKAEIVADLSNWLRLKFPHHDLLPFGSSVMGLDFDDNSDIDLYLRFDPDNWETASEERKKKILEQAFTVICAHPDVKPIALITHARVPVAKFVHAKFGVHCDLTVDNIKGVMNSKFIASLLSLDPRIRPFLLMLKLWAKTHRLTGADQGTITSYALTLLGIFYLQRTTPPLIPPIASLQSQVPTDRREICHGWDFSFVLPQRTPKESPIPQDCVFALLKGFFNFFQTFDPKDIVICPLLGDVVPRENFTSSPPSLDKNCFKQYMEYLNKGGAPFKFGQQLALQDPFELNFNVCAAFIKYERFQNLCTKAFGTCCFLEAEGRNASISRLYSFK